MYLLADNIVIRQLENAISYDNTCRSYPLYYDPTSSGTVTTVIPSKSRNGNNTDDISSRNDNSQTLNSATSNKQSHGNLDKKLERQLRSEIGQDSIEQQDASTHSVLFSADIHIQVDDQYTNRILKFAAVLASTDKFEYV